MNDFINFAKIV